MLPRKPESRISNLTSTHQLDFESAFNCLEEALRKGLLKTPIQFLVSFGRHVDLYPF
jgi:hypothetical protein